jgi:tetratricopeptide (TPR) repeat protein
VNQVALLATRLRYGAGSRYVWHAGSNIEGHIVQVKRIAGFRTYTLAALLTSSAAALVSCGQSLSPAGQVAPALGSRTFTLPKDDVLHSLEVNSGSPPLQPASPWRQEESQLFTDVLKAHPADILVIPFEVQDRGFDRIERSLMTADFASALSRHSPMRVLNPYLAARTLGEGQRRYQLLDVLRLADAVKARVLIRGYVGHDGHGRLALTLTVQQRVSTDHPWDQRPTDRAWTGLPFSDENLPFRVVHRLQSEMLSLVNLASTGATTSQSGDTAGVSLSTWSMPQQPSDLVVAQAKDLLDAATRFAILAAIAPMNPEITRERLAERGLLLLDDDADNSPEARFLRSYLLHLLHRRPAALAALGDAQSPANMGLRAVLNGNLDSLETAVAQSPPPFQGLLLEFELCYLKLEYGSKCDYSKLPQASSVGRLSRAWNSLVSNRLTDVSSWDVQSNADIKRLLDSGFPIPDFSLTDIERAAIVVGNTPSDTSTIDLSVIRHVRKILLSDNSLPFDTSEFPDRLDYLQLLEGLGESNLLKAVARTGFMQDLTSDALQQLRTYETVYAGHPAFAELHSRLLHNVIGATHDQPSAAIQQEFEQARLVAAYLEQGETAISASVLNDSGRSSPSLNILADAYTQDFPIRPWWQPSDAGNPSPRLAAYVDSRDRRAMTLDELAYAETEIPAFTIEQPFVPLEDLRKLLAQRFRGSPTAAEILAHIAGPQSPETDPAAAYREAMRRNPAIWSNYSDLGDWLLRNGDLDGAARAYLSYPGFKSRRADPAVVVANSNYAFEAGSGLYWRGAFEPARKLYQIAANNDDGSYASISSAGRLALLRGDLVGSLRASFDAAQRYQGPSSYRDYLCMLHAFGLHQQAWAGFNALAERFPEPEVWVSALVGQRMAATTPEQLRQWLLGDPVKQAHFLGRSLSADYALLWSSIDRDPPSDLPQLLDQLQGPSKATVEGDGLSTSRPSWRQEGVLDFLPSSEFRRAARQRAPIGSPVRTERTMFADAYVDLRAGRYADAVRKFDELAAHYTLEITSERYVLPYFAYASAKAGDPLHLEEYLRSTRVGGDSAAFLAGAFFEGLHGHKSEALDFLKAALYNRPLENTEPTFSDFRYAEACEWLYNDTHEDAYRQLALDWARMQQRARPELSWTYALQARLLMPGPERTRALAMTLYFDPLAKVVESLSAKEKNDLTQWLDKNNPFTHQRSVSGRIERRATT